MRVLIVGASGHLGAHLARVCLARGCAVRALVRPTSDTRGLAGLDVEVVRGDVRDPDSLRKALAGCRAAYHLGAPTRVEQGLEQAIRQGTRNVLEQALAARLERVVYTSSVVTVGYADGPGVVLDEQAGRLTPATSYHVAKWHAERDTLEFGRRTGLPVVVVNPATVIGPLDYRVTPSNAPLQRCLDSGLPFAFASGLTVVHAEDVARGHFLAMERARPGGRYILGGERVTVPSYFKMICAACGRPGPYLKVPRAAMLGLGACFGLLRKLGWRSAPFTFSQVKELVGRYGWYSSAKAARELGYSWRPAREAIVSYVEWVRAGRPASGSPGTRRAS
jgi:dihydroflavonol-4-reductase